MIHAWSVDAVLDACGSEETELELSLDDCPYRDEDYTRGRDRSGARAGCPSYSFDVGDRVGDMAFSSDSEKLLTGGEGGHIWDLTRGREIAELPHEGYLLGVDFSADDRFVATASIDHMAGIWDANTGENKMMMQHNGRVEDIVFSADSNWVGNCE